MTPGDPTPRRRSRRLAAAVAVVLVPMLALVAWAVMSRLAPIGRDDASGAGGAVPSPAPPPAVSHTTVTLFRGSADGQALVPVRTEIVRAEGPLAQGREIILAQLDRAPSPYVSLAPPGTTLRAFHLTGRGDAFVDLSTEVASRHPGGSAAELLTVYAIVNSLTANLTAVRRVQILVDGREIDSLAGHVDLRGPLGPDGTLVRQTARPR